MEIKIPATQEELDIRRNAQALKMEKAKLRICEIIAQCCNSNNVPVKTAK